MPDLVLLRHGESAWNSTDRFTGWVDVPLTDRGRSQARHAGRLLRAADLRPAAVHTSVLVRAVDTAAAALAAAAWDDVPVHRSWRLNERCYGALQGMERSRARERYGDERFLLWRRSYDGTPPPVEPGSPYDTATGVSHPDLPAEAVPRTESLADVVARLLPYWRGVVVPRLQRGERVLVVAHGNSLRALVSHLDALSPHEVLTLNIPTGMPLHYRLDPDLVPLERGGRYLEPAAAARAADVVAREGQPHRDARDA